MEAAASRYNGGMTIGDRPKPTGFVRLWRAFGNTGKGFVGAFREEAAFRQELALCAVLFPVALWLGDDVGRKPSTAAGEYSRVVRAGSPGSTV